MVRIPPFRGAQVAAGVVVLVTLAALLELRMEWAVGVHLAVTGALAVLVATFAVATPPPEGRPQPWLAAICLGALGLLAVALGRFGQVLGSGSFYATAASGLLGAVPICVAATWCAGKRRAASCAFVAGVSGTVAVLCLAEWVGNPSGGVERVLLLLCAAFLTLATLTQRDRRPQHGAQLANAGGLAVAAIALTGLGALLRVHFYDAGNTSYLLAGGLGWGWQLVLLAAGFGLMAYGAVDGVRGPVVVGLLDAGLFVFAAANGDSDFVGWPLVLLLIALALLAIGVRPTTPAPPEPSLHDEEPPAPLGAGRWRRG